MSDADPAKESRESELYTQTEPEQMSIEDYKGLTFSYKKYAHMQNHIAGKVKRKSFCGTGSNESLRKLGYQIEEEQ